MTEETFGKMNPDVKAKWVRALRSRFFKQTQGNLSNSDNSGDCCLGVLCKLAVLEGVELNVESVNGILMFDCNNATLPYSVMNWADLPSPQVHLNTPADHNETPYYTLAALNDSGATFDYIADVIEQQF